MSVDTHDDDDELRQKREARESRQSWAEFNAEIDRRLDAIRPDRIGQGEYDWREPVYGWARNHLPDEANIVRTTSKRLVDTRERTATRRGNDLIRAWMHGRLPLSWRLVGPLPIVVGKVRVRLDVATPEDVEEGARQLLDVGTRTFAEVQLLVSGLLDLARAARAEGYQRLLRLGDLTPRHDDDVEDFWKVDPEELDWDDAA